MKKIFTLFLLTISFALSAQITGRVINDSGEPLEGVDVYWANTTQGVATDNQGAFSIGENSTTDSLVFSYVMYHSDTIRVDTNYLTIVLVSDAVLDEVEVARRKASVQRDRFSALDIQTMSEGELIRAACCNLSESFETSASVDVAYSDAATGAKQIRMLGLAGTYVQILTENTPSIRGLANNFGLTYIPGPWMQSIQISKGTSSVINGFEATAGQINIEFLKPDNSPKIALNAMINSYLHTEVNAMGGWKVADGVHTGLLAHYENGSMEMDDNKDGFLDMPTGQQANLLHRWSIDKNGFTGRYVIRGLYNKRHSGQTKKYVSDNQIDNPYSIDLNIYRAEGFFKNGYVFDAVDYKSLGTILSASYHRQTGHFGNRQVNTQQINLYLNILYTQNINDANSVTAGVSVNYDSYLRDLIEPERTISMPADEVTPGIFAEYSFKPSDKLSLLVGLREDWSNKYGFFTTPRINARYAPFEWWHIRASAGLSYRTPNILTDNAFLFPSSRQIVFADSTYYQEKAINTGASMTFYIPIATRQLTLTADYYYTRFIDAVVTDLDQDAHKAIISNLQGLSYSHAAQVEAQMEVLRGWTISAAYRFTDVRTTYNGVLRIQPLVPRWKALVSTSYQTPLHKWQFDFTAQFNGGGRLPDPDKNNPLWNANYKWYPQLFAQITRFFRTWSIYVGAENMTNYKQDNPVIAAQEPFGTNFDASMVYAPLSGWKVYAGFRWALE